MVALVQHQLDAGERRVTGLVERGVAIMAVGVVTALGVEGHRIDGVDREVDVGLRSGIHRYDRPHLGRGLLVDTSRYAGPRRLVRNPRRDWNRPRALLERDEPGVAAWKGPRGHESGRPAVC